MRCLPSGMFVPRWTHLMELAKGRQREQSVSALAWVGTDGEDKINSTIFYAYITISYHKRQAPGMYYVLALFLFRHIEFWILIWFDRVAVNHLENERARLTLTVSQPWRRQECAPFLLFFIFPSFHAIVFSLYTYTRSSLSTTLFSLSFFSFYSCASLYINNNNISQEKKVVILSIFVYILPEKQCGHLGWIQVILQTAMWPFWMDSGYFKDRIGIWNFLPTCPKSFLKVSKQWLQVFSLLLINLKMVSVLTS